MAFLTPQPRLRFFDAEGVPLQGGKVYTYAAGTTTPKDTYTDQSGNTPNSNPVDLDNDGGASIWFDGAYKIDVKDADGDSLPGYPVDNVNIYDLIDWSGLTATIADLNATDTSTVSITTTSTITLSQRGKTLLCNATSGAITVNLLPAGQATNGYEITIKKTDVTTNLVTIDGYNSETIEGRTTFILYDQNDVVTILCDGSNWRIKSGVIRGNTELKSDAFTVTIADINKVFLCSATAAYAVTLLSAVTAGDGFEMTFKKLNDEEAITLTPAGMETIDGQSNFVLRADYQYVTIKSNGTNWYIVNEDTAGSFFQTGDLRLSYNSTTPNGGWLRYALGTIGSATSGATVRANADTRSLFVLYWTNVTDDFAPIFTSAGVRTTRGATALEDFNANKAIQLPALNGCAICVEGAGEQSLLFTADDSTDELTIIANYILYTGAKVRVRTTNALPSPLVINTDYYVIRVSDTLFKLATSRANAYAGTAINLTTTGTGIQTIYITLTTRTIGSNVGEEGHGLIEDENATHNHLLTDGRPPLGGGGAQFQVETAAYYDFSEEEIDNSGLGTPHNNMQPSSFVYGYVKL